MTFYYNSNDKKRVLAINAAGRGIYQIEMADADGDGDVSIMTVRHEEIKKIKETLELCLKLEEINEC